VSTDLVAFLRECLAEDERVAQRVQEAYAGEDKFWAPAVVINAGALVDPGRVLRDVAAKRAIMDMMRRYEGAILQESAIARPGDPIPSNLYAARDALLAVVRHLASVYEGRTGYREEWRP
jgi:FAD/FMN-containing dehydrogenase